MKIILLLLFFSIFGEAKMFRADKINYIYAKAAHHLKNEPKDLKLIVKRFDEFDKEYMDIKHSDLAQEKLEKKLLQLDKQLYALLEEFGLDQTVQAFKEKMKSKSAWQLADDDGNFDRESQIASESLEKLWKQAKLGKFSEAEFREIYNDLKVAQKMEKTYEDLVRDLGKTPDENSIDFDENLIKNKKLAVKEALQKYHDFVDVLERKITHQEEILSEQRAKNLWKNAKDQLSQEAFAKIRREILDFENLLKEIKSAGNSESVGKLKALVMLIFRTLFCRRALLVLSQSTKNPCSFISLIISEINM
ncbi:unnamed protein product [Caenorhabditis angaria]|uniref:SXP/RAL-2 family protein Ani s 5-like cation-binding domain-containing protein n=1 Tax=Caenorhabditis angaria TaxID=860376 RepID=A0A9P1IZ88_9PELO|nr:unnamed protein product [Caenorhabditis angaria]